MGPEPRRVSPVRSVQSAECVWSEVLALDHRDAVQLRRLGGRRPERDALPFTYYRLCRRVYFQKTVKLARERPTGMGPAARHPKPSHGSGTPMQQQHSVWAKHSSQARVRVRQEHAPRPNSAVQKCPPMREAEARRLVHTTEGAYPVHV
jgi:hypothetical protein